MATRFNFLASEQSLIAAVAAPKAAATPSVTAAEPQFLLLQEAVKAGKLGPATLAEPKPSLVNVLGEVTAKFTPPAEATFEIATEVEASISHITAVSSILQTTRTTFDLLRQDLGRSKTSAETTLFRRAHQFVETYQSDAVLQGTLSEFLDDGELKSLDLDDLVVDDGEEESEGNAHTRLFKSGRFILKDIQLIEKLRDAFLLLRRRKLQQLKEKREALQELTEEVVQERRQLDALNRRRLEALDDYSVAQRLITEDWERVDTEFEERRQTLEAYTGLFYVLVRESAVGVELPDPLSLRAGSSDDPVPGCNFEPAELDESLDPFMDTVLDIPVGDWRGLRQLHQRLPGRLALDNYQSRRNLRLQAKQAHAQRTPSGLLGVRLAPLLTNNRTLITSLATQRLPITASLATHVKAARDVLSLEDLVTGPPNLLTGRARELHKRLNGAANCMLRQLTEIRPSIRLDWANASEKNTLDVERPETWPGLAKAEADDFNGIRTLVELVAWWFRQLDDDASTTSRSALRNFVRACLLVAASDDPDQILHGTVTTIPGVFRLGEALRLNLNREARLGTELKLLDASQRVIGNLRIDDHDASGAVATVTRVLNPSPSFTGTLRVIGSKLSRRR